MFSRIGIIGAGAMGRGIAQLFAGAGQRVWLYDSRSEAIDQALQFNRGLLERSVAKGRMSADELQATIERMQPAHKLTELAGCDLLIEAIVENLEAKGSLFVELESLIAADAVLATNTSSLSVTRIASACTVRLLRPLSFMRKNSAEPRLAMIRMKAMAMKIFMVGTQGSGRNSL